MSLAMTLKSVMHSEPMAKTVSKKAVSKKAVSKKSVSKKSSQSLLKRLEVALAEHYPRVSTHLRKGASETTLRALETRAGLTLPPALRAFMRWHDGTNGDLQFLDGLVWLPVEQMGELKTMMDEIIDEGHYAAFADDQWWSKGWIQFADDNSGYGALVVDMHGCFGGRPGQVLWVAAKDPTRQIMAPSFDAWLEAFVAVVEAAALEPDEDSWVFGGKADRLFARTIRGYPTSYEPMVREALTEDRDGLGRPTRTAATPPDAIPAEARWLVRPKGDAVGHWLVHASGRTLTEWSGPDRSRLERKTTKTKSANATSLEHDNRLRTHLSAGSSFGRSVHEVTRGEAVFAMHVGDGSSAEMIDLGPDGQTLAVATMERDARGAKLYVVDITTGRRALLHTEDGGGRRGQTFIHRVMFDHTGQSLYYQLNTELRRISTSGGEPEIIADCMDARTSGERFNPHVTRPAFDRARRRLLCFDTKGVLVRSEEHRSLFRLPVKKGSSEYREAALSPSGMLVALVHQSRHVIYGHEDAKHDETNQLEIWSVDTGQRVATLPLKIGGDLRRIGVSADDETVVVGTYQGLSAFSIASGRRVWTRDAEEWAYSPDGTMLALSGRGQATLVLRAKTRRRLFEVDPQSIWSAEHAELQRPQALRFSDDGTLLYEGGESGRMYVWKALR